ERLRVAAVAAQRRDQQRVGGGDDAGEAGTVAADQVIAARQHRRRLAGEDSRVGLGEQVIDAGGQRRALPPHGLGEGYADQAGARAGVVAAVAGVAEGVDIRALVGAVAGEGDEGGVQAAVAQEHRPTVPAATAATAPAVGAAGATGGGVAGE